jgi:hypothetical protein
MFPPGLFGGNTWKGEAREAFKETIEAAAQELRQTDPDLKIDLRSVKDGGDFLGQGMAGAVFKQPPLKDGTPTVIKIDKGQNEGLMAKAMIDNPHLGNLSSVPKYLKSTPLKTKDAFTGMETYAITREDLDDIAKSKTLPSGREVVVETDPKKIELHNFFGQFGIELHELSGREVGAPRHSWEVRAGRGQDQEDPEFKSKMERAHVRAYKKWEQLRAHYAAHAANRGAHLSEQFNRVAKDVDVLLRHGIFPCDLHKSNWGMRKSTGEVVMRDVGCANFIH